MIQTVIWLCNDTKMCCVILLFLPPIVKKNHAAELVLAEWTMNDPKDDL